MSVYVVLGVENHSDQHRALWEIRSCQFPHSSIEIWCSLGTDSVSKIRWESYSQPHCGHSPSPSHLCKVLSSGSVLPIALHFPHFTSLTSLDDDEYEIMSLLAMMFWEVSPWVAGCCDVCVHFFCFEGWNG
jgi:hypothetical protein